MNDPAHVSVLIVNEKLAEIGVIANAAFVLGLTAGREMGQESFGTDVTDGDGQPHRYLTKIGHYVRKATPSKLHALRAAFASVPQVQLVDYTEDAAPADYAAYAAALGANKGDGITYRAIHVYGPESAIAPLTKNLSRL